jgi:hypothetical protein
MEKSIGKVSRRLVGMVGGIFAIRTALRGLRRSVGAGFGFVKDSADFEESLSKFSVVFGDFAKDTARDLDILADAVGRPRTELIDFASTFQDTLVPMGIMREEAAGLSVDLVKLAVDAASFGNRLDTDAVRDFQSALVGNTETVRKYGIVITATNTIQEAQRLGLIKNAREITEVAKIQARLSLIQAGLSDAIGDAERTAGSFQNTMKDLRGEIQEDRVVFGQLIQREILDAIERFGGLDRVVGFVRVGFAFLTGITRRFIRVASDMAEGVQEIIDELGGADEVARGLAGDFFTLATISEVWLASWIRVAKATGNVFVGIERSTEVLVANLIFTLDQELKGGLLRVMSEILAGVTAGIRKIPLLDRVVDIPDLSANQIEALAKIFGFVNEVEKPARQYEQVWDEALGNVSLNFLGAFDDIRAILKKVEAEGLDFDFKLEGLFGDRVEVETKAKALGGAVGSAFGFGFGVAAELALELAVETAFRESLTAATLARGIPTGRTSGEEVGEAWVMAFLPIIRIGVGQAFDEMEERSQTFAGGFAAAMEGVRERFSDRSLGEDLANNTFGALENGIDSFSRSLVEGQADFSEFRDSLLEDIGQIIVKLLLMDAIGELFNLDDDSLVASATVASAELIAAGAAVGVSISTSAVTGSASLLAGGTAAGAAIVAAATTAAAILSSASATLGAGFAKGGVSSGPLIGTRSFAFGGIMPGRMGRSLPIHAYQQGGVATSPQLAVFGEGKGAEAFVPLGPNRKIPVEVKGDGAQGGMQVSISLSVQSLDPRGAADVILSQMPEIEKRLAISLQGNRTNSLVRAVRGVARSGR